MMIRLLAAGWALFIVALVFVFTFPKVAFSIRHFDLIRFYFLFMILASIWIGIGYLYHKGNK
jgi:hypothetical protein